MSGDPKKPFDAPPGQTPELLQKEMSLDRRQRAPSFEELNISNASAEVPTDPMRPAAQRPGVIPQGTVPARPSSLDTGMQVPTRAVPPNLAPRTAPPPAQRNDLDATQPVRPAVARPPIPPGSGRPPVAAAPPAAPRTAAPPAPGIPRSSPSGAMNPAAPGIPRSSPSGAMNPAAPGLPRSSPSGAMNPTAGRTPSDVQVTEPVPKPTFQQRAAPPSPVEFAQTRPAPPQKPAAQMPHITPSTAYQGALPPEGHSPAPRAPQMQRPAAPQPPRPAAAAYDDHDEPKTIQGTPRQHATPLPVSTIPPRQQLPPEMLVTQPGLPGPFARAREMPQGQAVPQRPPSLPELPAQPAPAPQARPPSPSFDALKFEPTGAHAHVTAEPASLWRRCGAWLTDLLFVSTLVLGLLFVAMQVIAPKNVSPLQQLIAIAIPGAALAGILAFVYTALFAFLWSGRTPGRRLMGIHLVDASGHAPAPLRSLIRALLSLVSFGLFLSGFWLALFDRHGQTLHDKLTRTFVVKLQDA